MASLLPTHKSVSIGVDMLGPPAKAGSASAAFDANDQVGADTGMPAPTPLACAMALSESGVLAASPLICGMAAVSALRDSDQVRERAACAGGSGEPRKGLAHAGHSRKTVLNGDPTQGES